MVARVMACLTLLLVGLIGVVPLGAASSLTLVYSGNLDGELEPCGCSAEGNFGGLRRQATMMQQLRKQLPGLVFVSSGGLLTSESVRDKLKSEYILTGLRAQQFDAVGVQWRDLAYGEAFIQQSDLPWVSSNWVQDEGFSRQREIVRGATRVAVFSWLDPTQSPMKQKAEGYQLVTTDSAALAKGLRAARKAGSTTLLLTTLTLKEAKQRLPLKDVDVLLIRSNYEVFGKPVRLGRTLVLQPGSRGMRYGVADLRLDRRGGVQGWKHHVVDMPASVPDDPGLATWYQAYNDKVKAAYEAEVALKQQLAGSASPYVGAEACKACHQAPFEAWEMTNHAEAFARLEEVSKAFDPDCIVCHSVGYEKPGGFISQAINPELMNVQCESCHGAGREHAEAKGAVKTPHAAWRREQICAQCHTSAHSPSFRFEQYWPRIQH